MHTQPHTQAPDIRLISIAAAAEAIGLTVKTARNKLSSGTFPICTKRVREEELTKVPFSDGLLCPTNSKRWNGPVGVRGLFSRYRQF
jgi:hypothetical protein